MMTIWRPEVSARTGPRYRAIAGALSDDIAAGRLKAGDRLPTHRDLAWSLGVTVGTVSRAYAEAGRMGLIAGEVGRGTFVRAAPPSGQALYGEDRPDPLVVLNVVIPPPLRDSPDFADSLNAIASESPGDALISYQPSAGNEPYRRAGAAWIAKSGLDVDPDALILTVGAQHGILAALAAVTRPGDRIFTEALTYPGVQPAARLLGLRLEGLPIDDQGILPEALEAAAKSGRGRVLYCIPNLQNPTTAIMPEGRRRAIARLAERYDLTILEDDVFGLLLEVPPMPIACMAPSRTIFLTSVSKTLAPGLRVGFVAAPESAVERVVAAVGASAGMTPPLTAEVVTRWIGSGAAERILALRRREAGHRRQLVLDCLEGHEYRLPPGSLHLWLTVPEPWRAADFALAARNRGVVVTPAEAFVVEREAAPHAVRVAIGGARDRAALETALESLAQLLSAPPLAAATVM